MMKYTIEEELNEPKKRRFAKPLPDKKLKYIKEAQFLKTT